MQTNNKKEKTVARSKFTLKNNHLIQCFVYQNVALFKGDTYVYRGLFNRFGGYYDKSHFGFIVPLNHYEKVGDEIMRMAFGFNIYKKESEVIRTTDRYNVKDSLDEPVNTLNVMDIS